MKILVNKCYGGFSVSDKFIELWDEKHPEQDSGELNRTDPEVIALVEYLGEEANSRYSKLTIVNIPDDTTDWMIDEYDGWERIIYVVDGKFNFA